MRKIAQSISTGWSTLNGQTSLHSRTAQIAKSSLIAWSSSNDQTGLTGSVAQNESIAQNCTI